MNSINEVPLCIDLDGTLIHSDMLHESALRLLRDNPLATLQIPMWLSAGKASLKSRLAGLGECNPATLPYNEKFLQWLRGQRAAGRQLILCTASDHVIAKAIASHLALFDDVIASNGTINLAGVNKAEALVARFGERGFDYAGNSTADIEVWKRARRAVVVGCSSRLLKEAKKACPEIEQVFEGAAGGWKPWLKMLRVHQWLKNLLLFVPLFAAHRLMEADAWLSLLPAFASFCLCASAVYITNDLLDLESDRLHPRKRHRPFASGAIPTWQGVLLAPLLLIASFLLAIKVSGTFLPWLTTYFVLTCLYSLKLKRLVLIDCLALAVLYTLRIIAGAAAARMSLSFWLLAFSGFLFLSLAFVKRYAELDVQAAQGKEKAHGRGYYTDDASMVQTLGIAAGFSSVLVLALYLNSAEVLNLYPSPVWIWGCVPVMLFWISWIWLRAHRSEMHDDPLVFAVKDKASLIAGAIFALFLMIGATGWGR